MYKQVQRVTPRGVAVYPRLNAPDTKFNPEGVYSVKLRFSGAEAETMRNLLDGLYKESFVAAKAELEEKGKKTTPRKGPDPYQEEEGGDIVVNFKMKASGTRKDGTEWRMSPKLFDATGTPCPNAKIGGGSVLKVAFTPNTYYVPALGAGVSCRLEAVQVIELVEWGGGGSADSYGFGTEDGYQAKPEDEESSDGLASEFEDESEDDNDGDF